MCCFSTYKNKIQFEWNAYYIYNKLIFINNRVELFYIYSAGNREILANTCYDTRKLCLLTVCVFVCECLKLANMQRQFDVEHTIAKFNRFQLWMPMQSGDWIQFSCCLLVPMLFNGPDLTQSMVHMSLFYSHARMHAACMKNLYSHQNGNPMSKFTAEISV